MKDIPSIPFLEEGDIELREAKPPLENPSLSLERDKGEVFKASQ
jgi:hypothetical protein